MWLSMSSVWYQLLLIEWREVNMLMWWLFICFSHNPTPILWWQCAEFWLKIVIVIWLQLTDNSSHRLPSVQAQALPRGDAHLVPGGIPGPGLRLHITVLSLQNGQWGVVILRSWVPIVHCPEGHTGDWGDWLYIWKYGWMNRGSYSLFPIPLDLK